MATLFTVSFLSKTSGNYTTSTFQTKQMAFKAARMLAAQSYAGQVKVYQGQAGGYLLRAL